MGITTIETPVTVERVRSTVARPVDEPDAAVHCLPVQRTVLGSVSNRNRPGYVVSVVSRNLFSGSPS